MVFLVESALWSLLHSAGILPGLLAGACIWRVLWLFYLCALRLRWGACCFLSV